MDHQDCEHVMPSGRRCGSPRKRNHTFCYWHLRLREKFELPGTPNYRPPCLEDANAVTLVLNHVLLAQGRGLLDPRAARHIQWTLKIALQSFKQHDRPEAHEIYTGGTELFDDQYAETISVAPVPKKQQPQPSTAAPGLCSADTPVREQPQPTAAAPAPTSDAAALPPPTSPSDHQMTRSSDDQIPPDHQKPMTTAQLLRIIELIKLLKLAPCAKLNDHAGEGVVLRSAAGSPGPGERFAVAARGSSA